MGEADIKDYPVSLPRDRKILKPFTLYTNFQGKIFKSLRNADQLSQRPQILVEEEEGVLGLSSS